MALTWSAALVLLNLCSQEGAATTEPSAQAAEAVATDRPVNPFNGHRLDGSGYTLPAGRWQVGLIETSYGFTDWLSAGTSPYPWILAPLLQGFSANLGVKAGLRFGDWTASLDARYFYVNIEQTEEDRSELTESRVSASIVPLTTALTFAPTDRHAVSLAVRYTFTETSAEQSRQSQEVAEGAAAADTLHIVVTGRWRLTGIFGVYFRSYVSAWNEDLVVEGESEPDAQTRIVLEASIDPNDDTGRPWSIVGGAHLVFDNVNIRAGLGYGNYFPPLLGLALPDRGIVPDFTLYVRL
jgi:hypothetical protein